MSLSPKSSCQHTGPPIWKVDATRGPTTNHFANVTLSSHVWREATCHFL
jgi:hypothetical protein